MIVVKRKSLYSLKLNEMELPLTQEEYVAGELRRSKGVLIQNVYPQLDNEQREFLISGTTPEEWREMFGTPEDEKDVTDKTLPVVMARSKL